MKTKKYKWKGPATMLELWDERGEKPVFSTFTTPGADLPVAIDPEHPTVRGWIAFKLIEELPDGPEKPAKTVSKENTDA